MAVDVEAAQIADSVGENSLIQNHALVYEPARLGTDVFIEGASIGVRAVCVTAARADRWTVDTSAAD